MTKTKSTKRALLLSALSLLMCVSMLIGSTFAWFTDSVASGSNVITAGNLDIAVEYTLDGTNWNDLDGADDLFHKGLWEPGHTEVVALRIKNNGSLALKYVANMNIVDETKGKTKDNKDIVLSDILTVSTMRIDATGADPFSAWVSAETVKKAFEGENGIVYGESVAFKSANVLQSDTLLETGKADYIFVKVDMAETVGNEANHNGTDVPSIEFGINVLATQVTYENDSFGNQYDADSVYGTYIELNTGDDLLAAMASAEKDMPLTIKLNGNVEWPTEGHHGENDITPASSIVIDGNGYTITATGSGVTPLGDTEASMTLKNVKIADKSVSYAEDSWEFSYLEMGGKVLNCVDVDFVDPIMVESEKASFTNCTFVGYEDTTNNIKMNGVWMANGDATFTDCTFTGTRGMKICDMYAPEVGTVVIDGCTFMDLTQKPGVAIDDEDTQDMKVTIKNSTFINCQPGDQGLYIYETDNTVPTVENNIVESYKELVEIATKDQLVAFANRVNGGDGMSGVLVKLTDNIDLAGMEWTPIGQTGTSYGATSYFGGIFDGQGYTISNMTISQTNDGEHYAAGFFGFIDAADVTIRNVNFDKASVEGHHWTAVVAGYLTGNIDNCNVTNSTVSCTHANDDACGDKAGAVVGYVNSGLVNNCSVSDATVSAGRDAGQVVGASKTTYVANCTATNVTVSATGDCTGANVNNAIIGRVMS